MVNKGFGFCFDMFACIVVEPVDAFSGEGKLKVSYHTILTIIFVSGLSVNSPEIF